MRYELYKLLGDDRLRLLLILVVLGNGLLFYRQCVDDSQGYTLSQVQAKYQDLDVDELNAQQEELWDRIVRAASPDDYEDAALLTGDIYHEYMLNHEILKRAAQTLEYEQYRQGLVGESLLKLKMGLLGDSETFAGRSLLRGAEEYAALEGVAPELQFSSGVELLIQWHFTDVLLLIFAATAGLFLVTYEKGSGLNQLTRPARYGHFRLYRRKYSAMVALLSVGFLLLYGTNGLMIGGLFGYGNLDRAVQSIYGYNGCPLNISLGSFLLVLLLLKYLWALACGTLIFFLCTVTGTAAVAAVLMAASAGVAIWLAGSRLWWLRSISLSQFACIEQFFQGAIYLNLFGKPIQRIPAAILFAVFVMAGSFAAGAVLYCRTPCGSAHGRRFHGRRLLAHRHTSLFCHEWHKFFSMCRGTAVLLLLLMVQIYSYRDFYINNTEYEYYYRNYSLILSGEPTAEKAAYLGGEKERFAEIHRQIEEYTEQYGAYSLDNSEITELQVELQAEEAFRKASSQYEGVTEGQSYLYQTGYERLFNSEGLQDDLVNMAKCFFALILVLSAAFAADKESGVQVLQTTVGRSGTVLRIKGVLTAICIVLAAAIAFLPQYIVVFRSYGGLVLSAQANSAVVLASLPSQWTIGGVFAAIAAIRLILAGVAAGLTAVITAKTGNTVISMIVSLVLVLIPVGAALLLYT